MIWLAREEIELKINKRIKGAIISSQSALKTDAVRFEVGTLQCVVLHYV